MFNNMNLSYKIRNKADVIPITITNHSQAIPWPDAILASAQPTAHTPRTPIVVQSSPPGDPTPQEKV